MKKVLFITLLALITFSCHTTKKISTSEAEVKTAANLTSKQSTDANLNIASTAEIKQSQSGTVKATDTGTIEETIDETNTTTNYSTPDSTGNQYPISITTNKKTIHRGVQNNLNTNVDNKSNIDYLTRNEDKSEFKIDESITDKGKSDISLKTSSQMTEETKTPGWVTIGILILIFIGLGFIYYLLKKYNVLK